jgi:hypothetical protein
MTGDMAADATALTVLAVTAWAAYFIVALVQARGSK